MITNVTIEKVKGIVDKSFDSLRATKMELKDTNVPIGGDNVSCKLSITDNGISFGSKYLPIETMVNIP